MLINNKISRFLNGPYIFFGIVFLVGAIASALAKNWWLAGINSVISWYLFATFSGVEIETEKRKYREYDQHFGIYKTGAWKNIDQYIGLTLVSMETVYRMYSRSNRKNTSDKKEYRVYFVNNRKRPAIPVKICKTYNEAQDKMDELALWLHLPVFSIKR